ncbi:MAG: YfbM family protein [Pseudomonadota bacterium]
MGMVWIARQADENEVAAVRSDPDSVMDFLDPEDWDTAPIIDLDKEWHALHFLLTQSAGPTSDPLSLVLGNHEEIGEDVGYGPAFLISAKSVKAFSEAVQTIDEAALKQRYDTKAMVAQQVYLGESYDHEGEQGLEFLTDRLNELRDFAAKATAGGFGLIAVIT